MQRGDRGFRDILTQAFPAAPELRAQRDRVYRGVVELIEKAKATGRLRADFVPEDIPLVLMANAESSPPPPTTHQKVPTGWSATSSKPSVPPPPTNSHRQPRHNACTAHSPGTSPADPLAGDQPGSSRSIPDPDRRATSTRRS